VKHRKSNTYKVGAGLAVVALLLAVLTLGAPASQAQVAGFAVGQLVSPLVDMNLRSGPARSNPSLGILKQGEVATVTGAASFGWYPLSSGSLSGWASGEFLRVASQQPSASATARPALPTATENQEENQPGQRQPLPTSTAVTLATPTAVAAQPVPTTTRPITPTRPGPTFTFTNSVGISLGVAPTGGNVRSAPSVTGTLLTTWRPGRVVMIYGTVVGDNINGNNIWYKVGIQPERERDYYMHSSLVKLGGPIKIPVPQQRLVGRWIDVNLTQQTLTAFEGQNPVLQTLISSGTISHTTNVGRWKIYYRLEKQTMENREVDKFSPEYYKLADVPYPQYFNLTGEAIHGTFWHDDFGRPHSHGCINATTPASTWLYKNFANVGTPVIVHY